MHEAIGRIVTPVLDGVSRELGEGYAAVLYGSGARGEFLPDRSDVNLLLVCESLGPATLRRLSATFTRLRELRQPPPLLLERREWDRAADVFPIEVTDMQLAHERLRGTDPITTLRVDPADLRRALEQELRSKLLLLRQAFTLQADDELALGTVGSRSVASVATLFRVALPLLNRAAPAGTPACLSAAGAAMGVDTRTVAALWERRRDASVRCAAADYEAYLEAVAAAVRFIDQFTPGGN